MAKSNTENNLELQGYENQENENGRQIGIQRSPELFLVYGESQESISGSQDLFFKKEDDNPSQKSLECLSPASPPIPASGWQNANYVADTPLSVASQESVSDVSEAPSPASEVQSIPNPPYPDSSQESYSLFLDYQKEDRGEDNKENKEPETENENKEAALSINFFELSGSSVANQLVGDNQDLIILDQLGPSPTGGKA